MRFRLSLLMFLQWAIHGSVLPLYSTHLQSLGFSDREIGVCAATQAVGVILSSFLAGQIADRWFSADRSLACCAVVAAADLWVLAGLTDPAWVFVATLLFWLVAGPLVQLGVSICFAHLSSPDKQFGPIRMWGTIGWMATGWVVGYWLSNPGWGQPLLALLRPSAPQAQLTDTFRIGALIALVMAGFALTLPRTPPQTLPTPGRLLAPLAAMRLLRDRSFAVYCLCMFGLCITFPLTTQNTPLLLKELGVSPSWVGPTLTIAQSTEVAALGLLPMLLLRLGVRGTMLLGLGAWVTAMTILSVGQPVGLVVASQVLNGVYVAGFMVAGQVYVNSRASSDLRASMQGLFSFNTGLGLLIGNLLASRLRELYAGRLPPTFAFGAFLTACLLLTFVVGFRPRQTPVHGAFPPEEVP